MCGTDLSCLHNGLYSVERFLLSICSKQCTQIRRKNISPQKCQMIGITVLPCQTTHSFMGVSDVSTIWLLRLCPPPVLNVRIPYAGSQRIGMNVVSRAPYAGSHKGISTVVHYSERRRKCKCFSAPQAVICCHLDSTEV